MTWQKVLREALALHTTGWSWFSLSLEPESGHARHRAAVTPQRQVVAMVRLYTCCVLTCSAGRAETKAS